MKPFRNPLAPSFEHIADFERYSDETLQAIRASSHFSGRDRRTADHVLFVRSVRARKESHVPHDA
jgi:hypothetical protein